MRRLCSCGRPIYRGRHGRYAGAGVARYWVVTLDPVWRHLDGTPACAHPGPGRLRTAGHVQVDRLIWPVFLVMFIVIGVRLLGLAL